jgi:UPF0755 protein
MKFLATLLILLLAAAGLAAWLIYTPFGPAATSNPIYVDIAPGTGTQSIAAQLEHAGAIRARYAFLILRTLKGRKLLAGEYRFDHPSPAAEVYARIARGDVYTIAVTIPEGYNIFDIADAVDKAGLVPHDKFLAAERADTNLVSDLSPNAPSLEGFLFPDTYRFPHHVTAEKILSTMVHRFRTVASQWDVNRSDPIGHMPGAPEWSNPLVIGSNGKIHAKPGSSQDVSKTYDLAQIVTLASLIEKEVSQDSERPMVAGVFVNRLAQHMPLATDPASSMRCCSRTAGAAPSTPPTSNSTRPTTPTSTPACRPVPSAIPDWPRSRPPSTQLPRRISISSPTGRAIVSSQPRSSSTTSRSPPGAALRIAEPA